MWGLSLAFDLVMQSSEAFEAAMKQRGSIQETIAAEGIVIYERPRTPDSDT
jgi:hypothetical protein